MLGRGPARPVYASLQNFRIPHCPLWNDRSRNLASLHCPTASQGEFARPCQPAVAAARPVVRCSADAVGAAMSDTGAESAAVDRYVAALHASPSGVRAAAELLRIGTCPRCTLRFCGCTDGAAFAARAPGRIPLLKSLTSDATDAAAGDAAAAAPTDTADGAAGDGAGPGRAAESTCVVCLGVMQLGDPGNGERLLYNGKGIDEVGAVMALGEKDGSDWKLAAGGAATDLDAALKSEGHEFDSFALDIHIPAQCGVREAAVLSHMRRAFPEEQLLSKPHRQVAESIFSLRDTWRAAMMPALQEAVHGAALDLESDMRCGIYFVHRGTSRETSILKLNRSRKRRRGKPKDIPLSPEEITRSLSKNAFDAIFALSSRDLELAGVKGGELFVPEFPVQVLLRSFRRPVHVGGYYRKLRRNISNSPWTIDGSRKGETSVQEAIGDLIAPALRADSYNMISAGREDIDVLMLGKGRPFVLEYQNARSKMPGADFFRGVEEQLVSSGVGVEASGLQVIGKELLKELKAGESEKQKRYLALVRLDREVTAQDMAALSDMKDLTLAQRTPVRVSHRRADLVREKMVYEMSCEAIDSASPALAGTSLPEGVAEADKPRMFWLLLRTSAGTYIKEFVHGDEEDGEARTTPNVGSLLNARAEILQLDVLEVVMDWL